MSHAAQMLASPIRACILSGARIPSCLLVKFTVFNHPQSGIPCMVPLSSSHATQPSGIPFPDSAFHQTDQVTTTAQSSTPGVTTIERVPQLQKQSLGAVSTRPSFLSAYVTSQSTALARLATSRRDFLQRLVPLRWKYLLGRRVRELVLRKDMAHAVIFWIRSKIINQLLWLASHNYVTVKDAEILDVSSERYAALLWVGESLYRPQMSYAVLKRSPKMPTPFFDLHALLGNEGLAELRAGSGLFVCEWVVLKYKSQPADVVKLLWKLLGLLHQGKAQLQILDELLVYKENCTKYVRTESE